jgi:hypothetical protein
MSRCDVSDSLWSRRAGHGPPVNVVIVDDGGARWRNRTGWLWLFFLGPVFAGVVATLSPFAIALSSSWPSRAGYLIVQAAVWIAPLTLIWRRDGD